MLLNFDKNIVMTFWGHYIFFQKKETKMSIKFNQNSRNQKLGIAFVNAIIDVLNDNSLISQLQEISLTWLL